MGTDDRSVVVTGLGATTPLGGDVASTWSGMLAGKSGVRALTEDWVTDLPARIAEAIGYGIDMIRAGRADVVVAGGTEAAIMALNLGAFAVMRALSLRNDEPERASRPFDKGRDGFVLGEGAGMVVLESAEHAAARDANGC